jgi:hypothetical protein
MASPAQTRELQGNGHLAALGSPINQTESPGEILSHFKDYVETEMNCRHLLRKG